MEYLQPFFCFNITHRYIITELEAIKIITGAEAELVAAGGVCGAEGSCWIAVTGNHEQLTNVDNLIKSISKEPNFEL
jgi:hypothetical protein